MNAISWSCEAKKHGHRYGIWHDITRIHGHVIFQKLGHGHIGDTVNIKCICIVEVSYEFI